MRTLDTLEDRETNMFKKKPNAPPGRQRPTLDTERTAAVFSYHAANRSVARPAVTTAGRTVVAPRSMTGAAAERRATPPERTGHRLLIVCGVLVAGLCVLSLVAVPSPRLQLPRDSSGQATLLTDLHVYEQAAAAALSNTITSHLKPAINTQKVADTMAARYPELGSVSLELPAIGFRPILRVVPATPVLILTAADGQSFVLDSAGRAVAATAQAPQAVQALHLPVVTDQSGLPVHKGKQALPGVTTRFITEVAGQLHAAKLTIDSLTLPKGTSELDVRLTGQPYFVKFNLMGDAREEAGSFLAVKQHVEQGHSVPGQYIDVRVDGRAYYK